MSWFGLGPSSTLDVVLTNVEGRLRIDNDGSVTDAPLTSSSSAPSSKDGSSGPQPPLWIYSTGESVEGEARIDVPPGKKVEHMGIRVELKGVVELFGDKAGGHEFVSWVRELSGPGILQPGRGVFRFLFPKLELPYESYDGINAKCRYYVRVTVAKSGSFVAAGGMLKEQELIVRNALGPQGEPNFSSSALVSPSATAPVADSSVKLEVGIEDCLHIEFEYDRTRFALSSEGDTITGRLSFLLVRIAIKYAEIALIRRETAGPAGSAAHESETLTRFEIMDGCPVRGERIPIRLHLGGLGQDSLTPSYPNVANSFSVRYFLNLVLVDEEDRRYFKQAAIDLWRKDLKPSKVF